MHHHSQNDVQTAINTASILGIVLTAIANMIAIYGVFTYPATTLAAVAIGGLLAAIGIYQLFFWVWLDMVLEAEQGDGFSYSYAWPDGWVSCSYGGWKDLWIRSYYTGGSL